MGSTFSTPLCFVFFEIVSTGSDYLLNDVVWRDRDMAAAVRLKYGTNRPELQLAVYRGAPPTPRGTPGQGARYEAVKVEWSDVSRVN